MDAPISRPTNLNKAPLAGAWSYRDRPEDEPVPVEVARVHGACIIRFQDDEGTEVHFRDLPDWENWQEHFQRIGWTRVTDLLDRCDGP